MKKVLVTGAVGQIGSELVPFLRNKYGEENVIALDIRIPSKKLLSSGPFEKADITLLEETVKIVKKYKVDTIYHLAAILSAKGEEIPQKAWYINMTGLYNILEIARELKCSVFIPSSIAAFGPETPRDNTPQDTIQRPTSIYGITKVAGELLADYYFKRFGVDTRGVRYPGIISYKTLPGGGTTDYAVEIFYEAIRKKRYRCFLEKYTKLDMMYMPDAIKAAVSLMEADPSSLKHRNAFNVSAMSITPEELAQEIKKHIPDFEISYNVDSVKQAIANSWPNHIDDSCAREEWGWSPDYNLSSMTEDMIKNLKKKIESEGG